MLLQRTISHAMPIAFGFIATAGMLFATTHNASAQTRLDRDGLGALVASSANVPLPPRRPFVTAPSAYAVQQPNVNAPVALTPQQPTQAAPAAPQTPAAPRTPAAPNWKRTSLSASERQVFKQASEQARKGQYAQAMQTVRRLNKPLASSAIEWQAIRASGGSIDRAALRGFLDRHPNWPSRNRMRRTYERIVFNNGSNPGAIASFFTQNPPLSDSGRIAHVKALYDSGNKRAGRELLRSLWHREAFDSKEEALILKNYGRDLRAQDHQIRMNAMFYRDRATSGNRAASYLNGNQKALAKAWTAVVKREGSAGRLLSGLPRGVRNEPGALFANVQHLRRSDRVVEAARLILKAPNNPNVLIDTGEWWTERRVQVRMLLDRNEPSLAYQVAAKHASTEDRDFADAEFHAGWVALRYLNRPKVASQHFTRLRKRVQTPISLARADYWLGRAAEASGDRSSAKRFYQNAARFPFTYYGQLAAEKAGKRMVSFSKGSVRGNLPNHPAVNASQLYESIGRKDMAAVLLLGVGLNSENPNNLKGLAQKVLELGYPNFAVTIGKRGLARGHNLVDVAYPLSGLPNGGRNPANVERAFVYAIARQESEFRSNVKSPAGALGIMQLMPGTAKRMASETGQRYSVSRLTSDPVYNISLGSAYLAKRTSNFSGSYIMAAAAYNAGKSRVDTWMGRFGDPRARSVDVVDWVERIPFSETRNYVMRVMENVQVYRALLNGGSSRLQLSADLKRG